MPESAEQVVRREVRKRIRTAAPTCLVLQPPDNEERMEVVRKEGLTAIGAERKLVRAGRRECHRPRPGMDRSGADERR